MSEQNKVVAETQRWLAYAQRDLNAAQTLLTQGDTFTQQVCFLAQQGAEKALKAGLIFEQIEFPFRHDLDMLRNLLPGNWNCHQVCPSPAIVNSKFLVAGTLDFRFRSVLTKRRRSAETL